ncbi:IS1595-like element ISHvo5 family transposase [Haloferax volcanii]|uniref:ISH4-type transposase ISHvo5 n=3 Tax=Haloferax volcanii TaxID=2246 RepID=D4H0E8_HALVD|nr:IS1595-like element ISHvo5 family transposase [Haloferax volcanii]ADE05251.1 ISH4-type transposase ISHvo5 [Haloferax volcanii DS2]ELY30078.1 ISH4-type transposase [Haloferax volcanii DS2]MBS8121274.1 IS1595-like element ISHvo5 family transposase [Haloferax volcanii]MBS8126282.1 IS1595-like element ISHvo5 family transposase [Haloferax volcanii]MBS8130152.1 IS1595-like element ISHvo5 family transposase [Haloferax volcanii]
MIPLDVFGSESLAADLLQQVRWRDGVECPRCRSDRTVRNGSYGAFQRYLCKNCDRTFNDKTGTIFAHSKVALRKWLFSIYAFLRFNTSLRQLQREIGVTYKTMHRRVERFTRALDAPRLDLVGPVEIDEVYVSAGLKGRERDSWSRSRGLSTRGRGSYEGDKPPVFTIVDRGTGQRYAVPAKSADESTVRLLLADHKEESLTIYTDGFRAYDPLEDDNEFTREYVVHGDGEYADGDVHVNSCESHASLARRWLSPHRGVSKDKLTQYLRAFQLRSELFRKPGREALKHAVKATL